MGRRPTYSPAALVLMREGISLGAVGRRIGRTEATISRYLSGELTPHPDLIEAIRLVAGPEAAFEIADTLRIGVPA